MRLPAVLISLTELFGLLRAEEFELECAPSPADNPLRGLVPYVEIEAWDRFPHSLQFHYFSLRDLTTGMNSFDWTPMEKKLAITQDRGCQLIIRVMIEYPRRPVGVPNPMDGGKALRFANREQAGDWFCYRNSHPIAPGAAYAKASSANHWISSTLRVP